MRNDDETTRFFFFLLQPFGCFGVFVFHGNDGRPIIMHFIVYGLVGEKNP